MIAAREVIHLCGIGGYGPEIYDPKDNSRLVRRSVKAVEKAILTETEMLRACLTTPEIYTGIITEEMEKHLCELMVENKKLVEELKIANCLTLGDSQEEADGVL